MRTLLVDNYDSFTFNIFQLLCQLQQHTPLVIKNDVIQWDSLDVSAFDCIVLSPGPGHPACAQDVGICDLILQHLPNIPLLGICLGYQSIAHHCGAEIVSCPTIRHGHSSVIQHSGDPLFSGIPDRFSAVRYHSLCVKAPLPDALHIIAHTESGIPMALKHRSLPRWGVQFHPESICSEYGPELLRNFLHLAKQHPSTTRQPQHPPSQTPPKPPAHDTAQSKSTQYLHVKRTEQYTDSETAFMTLFANSRHHFWLDSSATSKTARFSFMGAIDNDCDTIIRYCASQHTLSIHKQGQSQTKQQSIFTYLTQALNNHHTHCDTPLPFAFQGGFFGYFSYEMHHECCDTQIPHRHSPQPDAAFFRVKKLLVIDHAAQHFYWLYESDLHCDTAATDWFETINHTLRHHPPLTPVVTQPSKPLQWLLARDYFTYREDIAHCLDKIKAGDSYEVCLTNTLSARTTCDALTFYRMLRQTNPAPYAAFFNFGDFAIASSSPERFLNIAEQGAIEAKPIKGTCARHDDAKRDAALKHALMHSEKDRAENLMITDLLRNDLGSVCEPGSVHVPALMAIESYRTVHQLVSTIRGQLRPTVTTIDAIKAAFPGGSMTGAPKKRTMEIIDSLEQQARGIYSGALGYISDNGATDLSIVIRTAILHNQQINIGAGGAIVAQSTPEKEFDEMLLKAKALITALEACVHNDTEVTQ